MKKCRLTKIYKSKSVLWRFSLIVALMILWSYSPVCGQTNGKYAMTKKNATLTELIQSLESQSKRTFLFRKDQVDKVRNLTVTFSGKTLEEALNLCLKGTGFTYEIVNDTIVIKVAAQQPQQKQQSGQKTTERKTLSGRVTDAQGQPLQAVGVMIVGTNVGAPTNADGTYSIRVAEGETLRFFLLGMLTREMVYKGEPTLNITLQESSTDVSEVVVTGIFTRKQESYTGSAVTLKGNDLRRVGNGNIFQSLKNLDPSLSILSNFTMGSDPNTLPEMKLRGTSTFPTTQTGSDLKGNYTSSPNTPLFILDGFETTLERIYDLDMSRIESITLLKDASAKALYGSKASNGVVVIETKRLLANQARVSYTGSLSLEIPDLSSYDLCNAQEKLQVEMYEGLYEKPVTLDDLVEAKSLYNQRLEWAKAGNSTYWLSKPLHVGIGHKHAVSIELGENALRSIVDFSYNDVQGVMKGSDRRTISGDVNLMYRRKNVVFKNIMSIQSVTSDNSAYGTFDEYAKLNPYWAPYNPDGSVRRILQEKSPINNSQVGNPLYNAQLDTKLNSQSLYVNNNFYAEVTLTEGLKAIGSFGISAKRYDSDEFYPSSHTKFMTDEYTLTDESKLRRGSYDITNGKSSSLTGKFDLQWNREWGKHSLFADLSYNVSQTKYTENTYRAEGFPSDRMDNISYARQYTLGTTPQSTDMISRDMSVLCYVSYSYDNRYIIDLTERANASSAFGNKNPWANFWSAGVAWNLQNESFMKNIKGLNTLKIRASYGLSGNQNFAVNTSYAVYNYNTTSYYNNFIGATLSNMENQFLKWESKKEFNVGADIWWRFINLRLDYYNALTSNMVTDLSIVPSTGFSTVKDNLGEVRNKGFEANLSLQLFKNSNGFLNLYDRLPPIKTPSKSSRPPWRTSIGSSKRLPRPTPHRPPCCGTLRGCR